jgi:hypothetical protein
MSRVNFPNNFDKLVKLFTDFKTKYYAEAGSSVTQPFLDEQGIDPTADEARVTAATAADIAFDKAEKDGEEFTEERDNLFNPVFKDHVNCVQFLKKLFRGNPTKLGEWGQTVDAGGRVVYPPDFIGRTVVVKALFTKHASFPVGTSPLLPYLTETGINLTTNATDVSDAATAHNNMLAQALLKEEKREERDNNMEAVESHLRGIGQFLVGLFSSAPHKAGQWGYAIDESARPSQESVKKIPVAGIKTVHNVDVGSLLTNNGPQTVTILPGTGEKGGGVPVLAGKKLLVAPTFGTLTVQNPSDEEEAVVSVFINR